MAAHATRSARGAASSSEDGSRCLMLALSHDELGVIIDGLADPLQPVVAVALSSTCLGLRTPLRAALEVLKERHARAVALSRELDTTCAALRHAHHLDWANGRWPEHQRPYWATLGMLLSKWLPRLHQLYLNHNRVIGDAGMQVLCELLGWGAAPALGYLSLAHNNIRPAGAEALAATLGRGALPKLERLDLTRNPIGNQGVAALAAPLRKLHVLKWLCLSGCDIGD